MMEEFQDDFKDRFHNGIMWKMFENQLDDISKLIKQLLLDSNDMSGTHYNSFIFDGAVIHYNDDKARSWDDKGQIHPTLVDRLHIYNKQSTELQDRIYVISGYIRKGLNLANTFKDIYALFPEEMHQFFDKQVAQIARDPTSKVTVTVNDVFWFREQTKEDVVVLKELILIRLLLR